GSPLAPGQSGNDLTSGIDGPHDLFVTKTVNSAFYGTPDLDAWLKQEDINAITICGIMTNFCCETTARMGGNLGYDVTFVLDATATFDKTDMDGEVIPADQIARTTAANLNGEFATVRSTAAVLGS
ncbi:MAG: isochorismatase family protein, partial [Aurantimicrobium sp.]|uniref:isochorismatase family protein n=1 Tax=Aurantimicrobium sp. TaxID=1930784 RepID=UPI002FCAA06E